MKIHVEIDLTPEEARRFLGLPDVAPLQAELMDALRKRFESGMADYDPVKLMEPFVTGNLKSLESWQKLFFNALGESAGATAGSGGPGKSGKSPGK